MPLHSCLYHEQIRKDTFARKTLRTGTALIASRAHGPPSPTLTSTVTITITTLLMCSRAGAVDECIEHQNKPLSEQQGLAFPQLDSVQFGTKWSLIKKQVERRDQHDTDTHKHTSMSSSGEFFCHEISRHRCTQYQ